MTSKAAKPNGSISNLHLDYYEARAKGGVGLITVEASLVNRERTHLPGTPGLFDDSLIPGWMELVSRIHAHGAKACVQIFDPGPGSATIFGGKAFGPSPVCSPDVRETPSELSISEIRQVIRDFTDAARRAKEAGMDMVQIHSAHDYGMVASFLSSYYNKRTDKYGGSLEDRLTFLLEIIQSIKSEVGSDFPIIVRLSGEERVPGGRTLVETQFIAPIIVAAGADALEISVGTIPEAFWAVVAPSGMPAPLNADAAEAIKKVVDVPVISVGRINTPRIAEFIISTGKADMVTIGRALIADPDFPSKAKTGKIEDIVPCVGDTEHCFTGYPEGYPEAGIMACLVNPAVMREKKMVIAPTEKPKKVLVVGSGPAGLEAARVAALRGHDVTLYEKDTKVGGQINIASVPHHKQELVKIIKYLSCQIEKEGVKTVLGREVTAAVIKELGPDAVVVATGAAPIVPEGIPGSGGKNVVTAWDVLAGKAGMQSRNIIIIGGSMAGCETADLLANLGDNIRVGCIKVTIVEMQEEVAVDCSVQTRHLLMERLRNKGVEIIKSTKVKGIQENSVTVEKEEGGQAETLKGADLIVLALGSQSVNTLAEQIKDKVAEIYVIGDAKKIGKARDAIEEGRNVGRTI